MQHRSPHGRPHLVGASVSIRIPEHQDVARLPACDVHAAVVSHRKHPRLAQVLRKHADGKPVWNVETLNILRRAIEALRPDDVSDHLNGCRMILSKGHRRDGDACNRERLDCHVAATCTYRSKCGRVGRPVAVLSATVRKRQISSRPDRTEGVGLSSRHDVPVCPVGDMPREVALGV